MQGGEPYDPLTDRELAAARAARAKAGALAGELRTLMGERPSITWTGGGAVRVSVRVRDGRGWERAAAVLAVLARGDRFGHRKARGREYLWVEIGGAPVPDEEW
ncbi:hypothetical protein KSE_09730 [Kitasatospora setae KM-6054]|uniref:Uncharacterized protein n=1 Tax=Kitasatospora setae (strain ATCC 33774 / DSM 43861 / JCM 3304 / KCC A-0304 / NBRC 14216 / KM-6054) TaxID=452652 RepID=E4N6H8_KITSK|nr:hypothetical protein KSE_09730 [Kitasatospora setae KM-6054]